MKEPTGGSFNLSPSEIVDITALDVDALARVVGRECDAADPFCSSLIRQEANTIAGMLETEAQQRLRSLSNLVRGLSRIAGRKTVILVSGGMLSTTRVAGRPDVTGLMSQLGELAAAADANFYVLHWDTTYDRRVFGGGQPARPELHRSLSDALRRSSRARAGARMDRRQGRRRDAARRGRQRRLSRSAACSGKRRHTISWGSNLRPTIGTARRISCASRWIAGDRPCGTGRRSSCRGGLAGT